MEGKVVEQYSELRERIARLGMTQTGLARRMKELGDDRDEKNILRSIQRMIAGDARVSGEMRAMLGMMEERFSKEDPSRERPVLSASEQVVDAFTRLRHVLYAAGIGELHGVVLGSRDELERLEGLLRREQLRSSSFHERPGGPLNRLELMGVQVTARAA